MGKFVTTGENASIFHDQYTGITVVKGNTVELNQNQLNSRRIKNALSSGHLVYVSDPNATKEVGAIDEDNYKKSNELLVDMYKSGATNQKIEKAFNIETLKGIAGLYGIEAENSDTKSTLVSAILEEVKSGNKKK